MHPEPHVSIIMPVYNGERYIAQAIDSVHAQTYKNYEFIIVNDGSTDNSKKIIETYIDKIKYIEQENKGIAGAYNTGIKHCQGKYIAFIEQDDFWLPHKIQDEVHALETDAELGMAYSIYYVGDKNGRYDTNNTCQTILNGACFAQLLMENLEGNKIIPFSAATVRAEILKSMGGLSTNLRISVDYDTWLKIAHKHKIRCIEKPALIYRQHTSNTSSNALAALTDDARILEYWASTSDSRTLDNQITGRIKDIYTSIAWQYMKVNNHKEEVSHLLKAAKLQPFNIKNWLLLLFITVFSPATRNRINWYKSRIFAYRNQ